MTKLLSKVNLYEFMNEAVLYALDSEVTIGKALNDVINEHIGKVYDNNEDFRFRKEQMAILEFIYWNSEKKVNELSKDDPIILNAEKTLIERTCTKFSKTVSEEDLAKNCLQCKAFEICLKHS